MKEQLKVSVIVPVYNAEQHLPQCLDSLLEQNLPYDCYEIICIDDGSKDSSYSIIKEYSDKYPNIRAIHKENEGVSATRNKGLDIARGKYVWFIDADDWVAKGFLGNDAVTKILSEENTTVPLILTKCIDVYDSMAEKYLNHRASDQELDFEPVSPFMTTARGHLFYRALIEDNQLRFNINLSYGEDLIFMRDYLDVIRFENEKSSKYKILQYSDNIYLYRLHDSSAMGMLYNRMDTVANNILYRARLSYKRYKAKDMPTWYNSNWQEYVNLNMQEYMIYYLPALNKPFWAHMKELKKEGLYPSPPPKLGWVKQKGLVRKIQQFAFKHSTFYPLYYALMRFKFKKAGIV